MKFKRSHAGQLADTVDCVILGVYTGKGKRTEFGVGDFLSEFMMIRKMNSSR